MEYANLLQEQQRQLTQVIREEFGWDVRDCVLVPVENGAIEIHIDGVKLALRRVGQLCIAGARIDGEKVVAFRWL